MAKSGEISEDKSVDNVYLMNHTECWTHRDDLSEWKSIQVLSYNFVKTDAASFSIKMYKNTKTHNIYISYPDAEIKQILRYLPMIEMC